jgi:hypothetical protein
MAGTGVEVPPAVSAGDDAAVGGGVGDAAGPVAVGDGDVQLATSAAVIRAAIHRFTGLILGKAATASYCQMA